MSGDGKNFTVNYTKDWYSGYLNPGKFLELNEEYNVHYMYFPS